MWYVTLSKARRSGRFGQTPQSLNSRKDPNCSSENDECPVDSDSGPSLGACFQVEHGWVDEAKRDTVHQLYITV
jgi:hypothetical protein